MLRILKYLIPVVVVVSCKSESQKKTPVTPEEKSQAAAEAYFKIEPKKDGATVIVLDSMMTSPNPDTLNQYMEKANYYIELAEEYLPKDFARSGKYSDTSTYYSQKVQAYLKNFQPELQGWKMDYTYKDKEVEKKAWVYLDTAFNVIRVEEK